MAAHSPMALSASEAARLAHKLDAWMQTLEPREVAFISQMLADAADAANEDASGYVELASVLDDGDLEGHALGVGPAYAAVTTYLTGIERGEAELADVSDLIQPST